MYRDDYYYIHTIILKGYVVMMYKDIVVYVHVLDNTTVCMWQEYITLKQRCVQLYAVGISK